MYAYQEEPSSRLPFPKYLLILVHRLEEVWSTARHLSLNRPDRKARLPKDYNLDDGLYSLSDHNLFAAQRSIDQVRYIGLGLVNSHLH
jgi:hypothetical protein